MKDIPLITPGSLVKFSFKTHNGDITSRKIIFRGVYFGTSPHFQGKDDWFMYGYCLDKNEERAFRLTNIKFYMVE